MSKRKSKKTPKHKPKVSVTKTPRTNREISPENIPNKRPAWRLSKLDFFGRWGFSNIKDSDTLKEIQEKLRNFETMTWDEIGEKWQNHFVPRNEICKDAQKRLKEIGLEEHDYLYSLRLSSTNRLWGIRYYEILEILWWDPKHTVCPAPKKHT